MKVSWSSGSFSDRPFLDVRSLMNIIDNLWDWTDYPDGVVTNPNGVVHNYGTTHTLLLGEANINKLSEEQIMVAINKGWTLS